MVRFVYLSVMILSFMAGFLCQVPVPTGLNVTNVFSKSITVRWNGVPNATVYEVSHKRSSVTSWGKTQLPGNQTTAIIDGLIPYTVYTVRITANTTGGVSSPSAFIQVTTQEAPPSELPKVTTIKAISCCSIYLAWNPISPEKANGVLLGYAVYCLKQADMSDYQNKYKKICVNISFTELNVTGLRPYTKYIVGVAAFNSKGVDKNLATIASVKRVQTKVGAPSPPNSLSVNFVSLSKLEIKWTLIPADKAYGIILGYRYVVYKNISLVAANSTVSNITNTVTVPKMNMCANYTVQVRAWTSAGPGMYTEYNYTSLCTAPKIINHKAIVIAVPYGIAVLHCNYTGIPTPSVTWMIDDRNTTIQPGHALRYFLKGPPYVKHITPYKNGSLINDFVEYSDAGIYTCILNNAYGSAAANTTFIVSRDIINVRFILNLTKERFDSELVNPFTSRHKSLRAKIKAEVLHLYSSAIKYTVQDVVGFKFSRGSVMANFTVTATARPGVKKEDVKQAILDTMIKHVQNNTLGQIPVSHIIIILGAPPPPNAYIVTIEPTYVIVAWTRPQLYQHYQIESYSIRYRKHAQGDSYKTVETVQDTDDTMKCVVRGLDPGQQYYIGVTSHRPRENTLNEQNTYTTLEVTTPDHRMKQVLLTIVLPIALAIILVVIILVFIRPRCQNNDQVDAMPLGLMPDHYGLREENTYDIGRLLEEFPCKWKEIPREDLTLGKELGAGAFGSVVRADIKRDGKNMPCAVKMLKRFATEREHRDLFNELSIMTQVGNHTNIVSLIGACTVNGPLWVIVKIAEEGCLLDYLHKHRKPEYTEHAYMNVQPSTSDIEALDKLQKLKFAHGIARGMKHLEKMKCVHRDLAARNVLLGKGLVPMVSDFGLSRDIYESGMYEDVRGGKRPVRWMAPESIEDYTCTSKSDVWSYGITLWEIETAGTVPYAGVEGGMDILNEIKKGYRLEQPDDCDDEVYELMSDTWRPNPLDRPTFKEIAERVEVMLAGISEYLEIQIEEEDELSPYDEVHISEQDLANGFLAQDHGQDNEDSKVRYTDIHGAALENPSSDVPINDQMGTLELGDQPIEVQNKPPKTQISKMPQDETSHQTKC